MKRQLLVLVAITALAGLILPTAAGPFTSDADTEATDITMAPSNGSNGVYAVLEDGTISLDLSESNQELAGDGVRDDTVTEIDNVFTITYTGESGQAAVVWLTHEGGGDAFEFYRNDDPTRPIQGSENSVELGTNETARVGLLIDTTVPDHDVESIDSFTIHAEQAGQETPTETPQPPGPPEQPTQTPTGPPATPTQTPTGPPATPTQTPTSPPATPTQTPTGPPATPTQTPTGSPATPTQTATGSPATPTQTATGSPATPTQTATGSPATPTQTPIEAGVDNGTDGPDGGNEDADGGSGNVLVSALSGEFSLLLLALMLGAGVFLVIGFRRDENDT